jgi:hypothetical protein
MILNSKLRKIANEITDSIYRIYYEELLNDEIPKDEWYSLVLKETIEYFSIIEEYEKCEKLLTLK